MGAGVGTVTVDHDHHQGGMTKLRSSWEAKLAGPKGEEPVRSASDLRSRETVVPSSKAD